jgi:hypothetical protein
MAEEKKPKIDLKARLGKGAGAATPPPPGVAPSGGMPVPATSSAPGAPIVAPPAASSGGLPPPNVGLPVPPGVPIGAAPLDPSNPLAAAMAPQRQSLSPQMPAQPQRIEVDEMGLQEATKKARRTGMVFAGIALLMGVAGGFVGGQAQEAGSNRARAKQDAGDLKKDVDAAQGKLEDLAKKLEAGRDQLAPKDPKAPRTFPKELAKQLAEVNVDFDGGKLAGRRFSGFPQDTSGQLFDFVTSVQALNDHKSAVKNLLTKLEKPLTEQIAAATAGTVTIQYMVLVGGNTGKDPSGNFYGILSPIIPPISVSKEKIEIPAELKGNVSGQGVGVPKYTGGDLNKPAALYLAPGSIEGSFPSDTKSAAAQLGIKLSDLIHELRGDEPAAAKDDQMVVETKAGLIERAGKLSKGLEKVATGAAN